MADEVSTPNGNGSPTRIPDWGQWLSTQMREGFAEVNRRIEEIVREPNRRIDAMEREMQAEKLASDLRIDGIRKENDLRLEALRKEVSTERESRISLQGSLNTWKWIIGIVGLPGLAGFAMWLMNGQVVQVAP